ncbi:hypothetical protein MNB_SUP05-12-568 [hydrothermal vent metagenome]|uniref:Uncharacterized protein n=1 Tax=hydrothermal vent metagenome TaxID=652676 RepID=A0A1W1DH65_9ZZZZ
MSSFSTTLALLLFGCSSTSFASFFFIDVFEVVLVSSSLSLFQKEKKLESEGLVVDILSCDPQTLLPLLVILHLVSASEGALKNKTIVERANCFFMVTSGIPKFKHFNIILSILGLCL